MQRKYSNLVLHEVALTQQIDQLETDNRICAIEQITHKIINVDVFPHFTIHYQIHAQMPSTTLPIEIWYMITENLSLGDLSLVYKVFTGIVSSVDIPSIATMHATKIIYKLFISGTSVI